MYLGERPKYTNQHPNQHTRGGTEHCACVHRDLVEGPQSPVLLVRQEAGGDLLLTVHCQLWHRMARRAGSARGTCDVAASFPTLPAAHLAEEPRYAEESEASWSVVIPAPGLHEVGRFDE